MCLKIPPVICQLVPRSWFQVTYRFIVTAILRCSDSVPLPLWPLCAPPHLLFTATGRPRLGDSPVRNLLHLVLSSCGRLEGTWESDQLRPVGRAPGSAGDCNTMLLEYQGHGRFFLLLCSARQSDLDEYYSPSQPIDPLRMWPDMENCNRRLFDPRTPRLRCSLLLAALFLLLSEST